MLGSLECLPGMYKLCGVPETTKLLKVIQIECLSLLTDIHFSHVASRLPANNTDIHIVPKCNLKGSIKGKDNEG